MLFCTPGFIWSIATIFYFSINKGCRSAVKILVFINVRCINFQYPGSAKLPWKQATGVRICISAVENSLRTWPYLVSLYLLRRPWNISSVTILKDAVHNETILRQYHLSFKQIEPWTLPDWKQVWKIHMNFSHCLQMANFDTLKYMHMVFCYVHKCMHVIEVVRLMIPPS